MILCKKYKLSMPIVLNLFPVNKLKRQDFGQILFNPPVCMRESRGMKYITQGSLTS